MPGSPVDLAPWSGGMNNSREASTIDDNQVAEATNLEFTPDGTAVSRPAIVFEDAGPNVTGANPYNDSPMTPLGYYVRTTGQTSLVVADDEGTYLYDIATGLWTTIWGETASGYVQYLENAVLISESVAGGYWDGASFTTTATMPLGSDIAFYQERFWAFGVKATVNANTVWFSNLTVISPASSIWDWTVAQDFFEVGPGDGQWITAIQADVNALLIFRNLSTWQFTFPATPNDGTLRQLSATNGADSKDCVAMYEGYYFVLNQGHLYQFISYQFYPLDAKKINLARTALPGGTRLDFKLSVLGPRVIVWYLGSCFVFNAITSTWSRWVSTETSGAYFLQAPPDPTMGDDRVAYGVTGEDDPTKSALYRIQESPLQLGDGETFHCTLVTKSYAFGNPGGYKRQSLWVVEVSSANGIDGYLHPQALADSATNWDALDGTTWDILDEGNWDNPLITPMVIRDETIFPTQAPIRQLIKLRGGGRFLRAQYELRHTIDGTVATAPYRIYSITPYLFQKARASKKVS